VVTHITLPAHTQGNFFLKWEMSVRVGCGALGGEKVV